MLYDRKAERSEAMKTLINLGLFIPCNTVELYHGRAKLNSESEEWKVNEKFNSAGNNTGHNNVYGITTLSTGDYDIAQRFAKARCEYSDIKAIPEVIKINSLSKSSVIFNACFSIADLGNKTESFYKAIAKLSNMRSSQGAPVAFEAREIAVPLHKLLVEEMQENKSFLTNEMVEKVRLETNAESKLLEHLAGAINAKILFKNFPLTAIYNFALENDNEKRQTLMCDFNGVKKKCPINVDWIAKVLSENNIIGVKSLIYSATLDDSVDSCFLFDISKVNTQKEINLREKKIEKRFAFVGEISESVFANNKILFEQLKNAKPDEVIKTISDLSAKAKERYSASSCVWEGFTIGEHTETVLRIFEEAYDLRITKKTVPFVKLFLAMHDIEKGVAKTDNPNNQIAREVLNDLKIEKNAQNLILGSIYELMSNISNYFIDKNKDAYGNSKNCCKKLISSYQNANPDENAVMGLMSIGKIVQTCDGGAYTRNAVTRGENLYYKNGNDKFTASFNFSGLTKEILTLR